MENLKQKTITIKNNYEFKRVYAKGRSAPLYNLVLYVKKNGLGKTRLGITVSQKVGCAVVRNRARRLIKEAFRLNKSCFLSGFDIVAVARARTPVSSFGEVERSLISLSKRLNVWEQEA